MNTNIWAWGSHSTLLYNGFASWIGKPCLNNFQQSTLGSLSFGLVSGACGCLTYLFIYSHIKTIETKCMRKKTDTKSSFWYAYSNLPWWTIWDAFIVKNYSPWLLFIATSLRKLGGVDVFGTRETYLSKCWPMELQIKKGGGRYITKFSGLIIGLWWIWFSRWRYQSNGDIQFLS